MTACRFASLGSGSRGNATLVATDNTKLLVDCGFTIKDTERRLQALGVRPDQLSAILVTHEHSDHIKGVGPFARKYGVPVHCSYGTRYAVEEGRKSLQGAPWQEVRPEREFTLGDITVMPVPVPHDAREPCQFVFSANGKRLGLLTDLGSITPHLVAAYRHCDALLLECNHDVAMLRDGPYPPSLKRRVGGDFGHLNNSQSAALLGQLEIAQLQHLVLSHLSEKNNHPDLALAAIMPLIDQQKIQISDQEEGTAGWLELR